MAVIYDLVLRNNVVIPVSYMCFGLLNRLETNSVVRNNLYTNRLELLGITANTSALVSNFSVGELVKVRFSYRDYIKSYLSGSCTPDSLKNAENELKKLLKQILGDIRITDGIYYLDEALGVFTVNVVGQPADKVMFLLQLARNLCREVKSHGDIDGHMAFFSPLRYIMSKGFTPFQSLVFSELFHINVNVPYGSSNGERVARFTPRYPDESSLFNHATLGNNGLAALLRQDSDYMPWFQGTFEEQGSGYYRDSHFDSSDTPSPILMDSGIPEDDERGNEDYSDSDYDDDDDDDEYWANNYCHYSTYVARRLCDWASVSNDGTAFHNASGSEFNETYGFCWSADRVRNPEALIEDYRTFIAQRVTNRG